MYSSSSSMSTIGADVSLAASTSQRSARLANDAEVATEELESSDGAQFHMVFEEHMTCMRHVAHKVYD